VQADHDIILTVNRQRKLNSGCKDR